MSRTPRSQRGELSLPRCSTRVAERCGGSVGSRRFAKRRGSKVLFDVAVGAEQLEPLRVPLDLAELDATRFRELTLALSSINVMEMKGRRTLVVPAPDASAAEPTLGGGSALTILLSPPLFLTLTADGFPPFVSFVIHQLAAVFTKPGTFKVNARAFVFSTDGDKPSASCTATVSNAHQTEGGAPIGTSRYRLTTACTGHEGHDLTSFRFGIRGAARNDPTPPIPVSLGNVSLVEMLVDHTSRNAVQLGEVSQGDYVARLATVCRHTKILRNTDSHETGSFGAAFGAEWGDGPADLALNILNMFVPPGEDGLPPVRCFEETASRTAWDLHQEFKREFIAPLERFANHVISGVKIREWIEPNRQAREAS